jgi:hypothetical protein
MSKPARRKIKQAGYSEAEMKHRCGMKGTKGTRLKGWCEGERRWRKECRLTRLNSARD